MGGKFSRDKGARAERAVLAKIKQAGFSANRVPLSGASVGYKGDIAIEYDNREILVEVKSRKKEFTKLYELLDEFGGFTTEIHGVVVSYSPVHAITEEGTQAWSMLRPKLDPLLRKCLIYRADSDILVVKDDFKVPIYLYWLEDEMKPGNA